MGRRRKSSCRRAYRSAVSAAARVVPVFADQHDFDLPLGDDVERVAPGVAVQHAIAELVEGIKRNDRTQVLLGVTGSGKTFTIANVIAPTRCRR